MAPARRSVLEGLLTGQLQATTTIISDSLVQPATLLFRELIEKKLQCNESVHLVCAEIDAHRFVESLSQGLHGDQLARLHILDCNLDSDTDTSGRSTAPVNIIPFEIDNVAGLSRVLQSLEVGTTKTTIFIDSINALETFNPRPAVLRLFRQCKHQTVAIHHTDAATSPDTVASSSKSPLLPLLLTASGSRSSIHLTMHPCSLLAHLHYVYGIENVGQSRSYASYERAQDEDELDTRVYQFLDILHDRGWGSPLLSSRDDDTQDDNNEESYGGREFDSPKSSRVVLDLLGCSAKSHGSSAGRCVVEHALRGVNKSNKRSDASRISRGLEGLTRVDSTNTDISLNRRAKLLATPAHMVLRIKHRTLGKRGDDKTTGSSEDPFNSSVFNLSLTDRQREEKDRVELPFTRGGGEANGSGAIIIYEPDSADDLDDSDPDEDLEL